MTEASADLVAGKLTKAQREQLLAYADAPCFVFGVSHEGLEQLGLLRRQRLGRIAYSLSSLGTEVARALLLKSKEHNDD